MLVMTAAFAAFAAFEVTRADLNSGQVLDSVAERFVKLRLDFRGEGLRAVDAVAMSNWSCIMSMWNLKMPGNSESTTLAACRHNASD